MDRVDVRIKTKRWNDPVEPDDGYRVLVCRYRPRGVRKEAETWDVWSPHLAPSRELLADYYGKHGPPLTDSTPTQIYEAMVTGPEAMPVFNDLTITPQEKRDIIAYVTQVRSEPNPGGFSLGRVGPVTEGLVAFLGLMLFMVLAALWITAKHGKAHE